ncbi:hypothetical protein [Mucilaginibacter aquaedulcis]|uniref:hypothetical protein n=1 Tax=Mucilaginibacter aquaedulcis TaxID=1187081 RepID=UPI0025B5D919|nr:hypothetical protein [Mucilaginibacter aquaedulcis]MDN3550023.1 hypothetical protein [Mucilaginibacter aquaedulcis]
MIITSQTELMKNQKHAVVMAPGKQFEVLQTQQGNALFFSIGTNNVFYLTREASLGARGWSRVDLSSVLKPNGGSIAAKLFDVAQDLNSGIVYIALVVTVNQVDTLYLANLTSNTDDDWSNIAANGLTWQAATYNGSHDNKATLNVSDINLCQSGQLQMLQADVIQGGSNAGNYVNRYYVSIPTDNSAPQWTWIHLPSAISAGNIYSEVGYLNAESAPGTYTLSGLKTLGSAEMELIFSSFYNSIDPTVDPSHIAFNLPAGTTAMGLSQALATADPDNYTPAETDLFVAAGSSLYFVDHSRQTLADVSSGLIYTHNLLSGVQRLQVNNTATQTILWGLNEAGQIFYMKCNVGQEAVPTAWSYPVSILENVLAVAPYIHTVQNSLVIFGQVNTGTESVITQMTQDTSTTHWIERNIVLPGTDPEDYVESFTYTTHIQLTDNSNVVLVNQNVSITSSSACTLYINDAYHVLYPDDPLTITCDTNGVITLVQSVDTLAGVCFSITDGSSTPEIVNPLNNLVAKLDGINLDSVNGSVSDEMGKSKPLLDASVTPQERSDLVTYIQQFISLHTAVPSNGSPQPDDANAIKNAVASSAVFGMHVLDGKMRYYGSEEEAAALGVGLIVQSAKLQAGKLLGSDNTLELLAGDGWKWLKSEFAKVEQWEIQKFGAINHFIFTIAEKSYHFALKCAHDIANGIHFVLNKIAVAFEDMVKWLGSIFAWHDILNTHAVLKQLFLKYIRSKIASVDTYKEDLSVLISNLETALNSWAGLPTDSYSSNASSNNTSTPKSTPSSNWGSHHAQNNATNGQDSASAADPSSVMTDLINAVDDEGDILWSTIQKLQGVFDNASTMTMDQMVKQIVDIILTALLDSANNIITKLFDVIEAALTGVEKVLDATIKIPVISPVYKFFTGSDLSILDLVCLLAAIPVTVFYKLENDAQAPFTAGDVTTFTNAADLTAIANLCYTKSTSNVKPSNTQSLGVNWSSLLPPELNKTPLYDKLEFAGNIAGLIGGCLIGALTVTRLMPAWKDSTFLAKVATAAYVPYIGPDIIQQINITFLEKESSPWFVWSNSLASGAGLFKALVDVVKFSPGAPPVPAAGEGEDAAPPAPVVNTLRGPSSITRPGAKTYEFWGPVLDLIINFLWEGPVIGQYIASTKQLNDKLGIAGNTLFNVSGVISPLVNWTKGDVQAVAAGISCILNVGYGVLTATISLDKQPVDS